MLEPRRLSEVFRRAGLRWTPQRQAVAEALWGATTHPTAEDVYRTVRLQHSRMSRATVYNTMEALAEVGQIETIHSITGTRRFDPNGNPHHHAICRACGRIEDVPTTDLHGGALAPVRIDSGFQIEGCRVEYRGICSSCSGGTHPQGD